MSCCAICPRENRTRSPAPKARRAEYEADVDLLRLAADLVIDAIITPEELRAELVNRYAHAVGKTRYFTERRHGVPPV